MRIMQRIGLALLMSLACTAPQAQAPQPQPSPAEETTPSPTPQVRASNKDFRTMPLDAFMQSQLEGKFDIPIPVPTAYAPFKQDEMLFYAYWMRPEDMARTRKTSDLPSNNGYLYGKLTESVGYDHEQDLFVGVEDAEALSAIAKEGMRFASRRYLYGQTPVLVLDFEAIGKHFCGAYIVLDKFGNLVYLVYRPPGNDRKRCENFTQALVEPFTPAAPRRANEPTPANTSPAP